MCEYDGNVVQEACCDGDWCIDALYFTVGIVTDMKS